MNYVKSKIKTKVKVMCFWVTFLENCKIPKLTTFDDPKSPNMV